MAIAHKSKARRRGHGRGPQIGFESANTSKARLELLFTLSSECIQNEYAEVRSNLLEAVNIARSKCDPYQEILAWETLADYARANGFFQEEKNCLRRILRVAQSSTQFRESLWVVDALCELGRVAVARGRFEEAETRYRHALHASSRRDNPFGKAGALLGLGKLYELREDKPLAEDFVNQATTLIESLCSQPRNKFDEAYFSGLVRYAEIADNHQYRDIPEDLCRVAQRHASRFKDHYIEAWPIWILGLRSLSRKSYEAAKSQFAEVANIGESFNEVIPRAAGLLGSGRVAQALGQIGSAKSLYCEVISLVSAEVRKDIGAVSDFRKACNRFKFMAETASSRLLVPST
jgi:tetratricopeptide (TPR) repeat protein